MVVRATSRDLLLEKTSATGRNVLSNCSPCGRESKCDGQRLIRPGQRPKSQELRRNGAVAQRMRPSYKAVRVTL
jgi:hypothetical protein